MSSKQAFLSLQNGSDIRGVSLGEGITLGRAEAFAIARAFGRLVSKKCGKKAADLRIGIGHDSRLSADFLTQAAIGGLESIGVRAFHCGLCSTPAMFQGTRFAESDFDGAIMLTASHLPFDRNGMKFFDKSGGFEKADIKAILEDAQADAQPLALCSEPEHFDLMSLYCALLQEQITAFCGGGSRPLAGLHVAVDAGGGAGGFFATRVLVPLGANIDGSRYLEPDGHFSNHPPNPENKEAMRAICEAVQESGADLGILFDTDVDRAAAVDGAAHPINHNAIVALAAALLPPGEGGTVVTDSVTSEHLSDFLRGLGLKHHAFRRGYRNVINEGLRLNESGEHCPLAIETSGHCAYADNFFLDDGAYLSARIIAKAAQLKKEGKNIADLIDLLRLSQESLELRLKITEADFATYGKTVLDAFVQYCGCGRNFEQRPSHEGVRFVNHAQEGWGLVRLSLHEPLLVLYMEADKKGGCEEMLMLLRGFLCAYPGIEMPS